MEDKIYMVGNRRYDVTPGDMEDKFLKDMADQGKNPILLTDPNQDQFTPDVQQNVLQILAGREDHQIHDLDINPEAVYSPHGDKKYPLHNQELNKLSENTMFNWDLTDDDFLSGSKNQVVQKLENLFGTGEDSMYEINKCVGCDEAKTSRELLNAATNPYIQLTHKQSGKQITIPTGLDIESYDDDHPFFQTFSVGMGGTGVRTRWDVTPEEKKRYQKNILEKLLFLTKILKQL